MSITNVSSVPAPSQIHGAADLSHQSPADVARASIRAHGVEAYGVPHALEAEASSAPRSSDATQSVLPALHLGG